MRISAFEFVSPHWLLHLAALQLGVILKLSIVL